MPLLAPKQMKVALLALTFGMLMLLGGVSVGKWAAPPAAPAIAPFAQTPAAPQAAEPPAPAQTESTPAAASAPPPPAAPEVQPLPTGYAVIVGVYLSPILAQTRRSELRALGHPAFLVVDPLSDGERVSYMVVTHTFPDYASALESALALQAKYGTPAKVRAVGGH